MNSIFVQIASYRDLELYPTLKDLYAKSSGENKITVGLVWQKGEGESIEEFSNDNNVRIISVPWNESKGLGWARSLTQSLYQDEDFTLQIDSHHRFSKNWDSDLIKMHNDLLKQSPKPLLTSYAAGYDPLNDNQLAPNPCKILPHDFKSSGTIWFNPVSIQDWQKLEAPLRGLLVSGHYFFTSGDHCKEYKYDPEVYFAGDEIALSVRSYTLGYDIYHPHKCFVWHHYGRNDRIKHWGDHSEKSKQQGIVEKSWGERDVYSKKRIRMLLGEENNGVDLGIYGLGEKRSLDDYMRYSGIDFKNKRINTSIINGREPPVTDNSEESYKKTTTIRLDKWPIMDYLNLGRALQYVTIEYVNLQRQVIQSEMLLRSQINSLENMLYQSVVRGDHYPMRVIFTGFGENGPIHKWERDLKPNIHWG